jgi:hypothetical protein
MQVNGGALSSLNKPPLGSIHSTRSGRIAANNNEAGTSNSPGARRAVEHAAEHLALQQIDMLGAMGSRGRAGAGRAGSVKRRALVHGRRRSLQLDMAL